MGTNRDKRDPYAHRVIALTVGGDDNRRLFVSAHWKDDRREWAEPVVSFAYVNGTTAAEWCPPHGPIQIVRAAEATDEGAQPHHIFSLCHPNGLDWSQMAVDDNQLPAAFVRGDTEWIFDVLARWARNHSAYSREEAVHV